MLQPEMHHASHACGGRRGLRRVFRGGGMVVAALCGLLLQSCQVSLSPSGGDEDRSSVAGVLTGITGTQVTATEVIGTVTIAWNSDEPNRSTVDIYLSNDSGLTFPMLIAGHVKDTGQYVWDTNTVADCRYCRLRMVTRDVVGNLSAPAESPQDFVINNVPQVLGSATYADADNDGPGAGDTITVPFDKDLELRTGIASDIFIVPVLGDSIGAFATVAKGVNRNELVITFNPLSPPPGAHLHLAGRFDKSNLFKTAASGINIRNNLAEGVLFAPDTGRTAAPAAEGIDIVPGFNPVAKLLTSTGRTDSVAVSDVNGDGFPDIVTGGLAQHQVWLNTKDPAAPYNSAPSQSLNNTDPTFSIALGDVNGDGRLDLVVTGNAYAGTVPHQVWLNTGSATAPFSIAAPTQLLTNTGYTGSVAIADLNGDGRADLVMGDDELNGAIRVWLNSGNTTAPFNTSTPSQEISTNDRPLLVALGDVNGDGRPDMVASGFFHEIWLNTGDSMAPFLGPSQNLTNTASATSFVFGDANGDGRNDLVVGVNDSGEHQLWLNSGNAAAPFNAAAPSQVFANDGSSSSVALGDVDGDGRADLLVSYLSDQRGKYKLWLNGGDSSEPFNADTPSQTFTSTERGLSVKLADVDGDGDHDLVATGDALPHSVFFSSARQPNRKVFVTPDNSQVLTNTRPVAAAVVADVNADGNNDIFVATAYSNHQVWLHTGNATVPYNTAAPSLRLDFAAAVADMVIGDVNGDGRVDAVAGMSNESHQVWLNTGSATTPFNATVSLTLANTAEAGSIALGDVNGDTRPDLVVGVYNGAHQVWLNTGDAVAPFNIGAPTQLLASSAATRSLALGDVTGDGRLDIVVGVNGGDDQLWINTGSATEPYLTTAPSQSLASGVATTWLALGDVNGDGKLDLAGGSGYSEVGGRFIWLNTGNSSTPFNIAPTQTLTVASAAYTEGVTIADVNGDGRGDLIFTGGYFVEHEIWLNTGNTTAPFKTGVPSESLAHGASGTKIALGDVDGDGDPDLFEANWQVSHKLWLNDY